MPDNSQQPTNAGANFDSNRNAGIDTSKPILQPPAYKDGELNVFGTSEILWWNNGIWGQCGYAIPNDGGKLVTRNDRIREIHTFLGRELFALMHDDDVKLSRPPNVHWLRALNKAINIGLKRIGDFSVGWRDHREGDLSHGTNDPEPFVYYPVPFFGDRIRQGDAKRYCRWMLQLLGEIQQHSDNEYQDDITDFFSSGAQEKLLRIQKDIAMKYLGLPRDAASSDGFTVPDEAFTNYAPDAFFTEHEMLDERRPAQWWPQTNDLTPIQGVPSTVAVAFGARWPAMAAGNAYGDLGSVETAFPAYGDPASSFRRVKSPGTT